MDELVRVELLQLRHHLVDIGVRDDPHAAAVMVLVDDVMIDRGVVRHGAKPPRLRAAGPAA
jgi:hypothetical protein